MLVLRLDVPTEPTWLDFPAHGVRVLVRPLTMAISAAIDSFARQQIAAMAAERLERQASGAPADDLPALDDPHIRAGLGQEIMAVAMARFGIIGWEGVGDENGDPLPVTPDHAAAFARQIGLPFIIEYERALSALVAEGNASGAGRNGASAPNPPIATPAPPVH